MMKKTIGYHFIEIIKCLIMGAVIGVLISLYKFAVDYVVCLSSSLVNSPYALKKTCYIIAIFLALFLSYFLIKRDGNIQGGGLPQIEMNICNKRGTIKWYKSLPLMFISSLLSFFCGLPLGSEAPSTFMGGTVGIFANDICEHPDEEDDIGLGMGVGFGTAFMSPASGICYAFEESLNKFSFKLLGKIILMMATAYLTAYLINPKQILVMNILSSYNWAYCYSLLFIIALCLPIALCLMYLVPKIKVFFNHHYRNFFVKNRFFFFNLLLIIVFLCYPLLGGNGHHLINELYGDEAITIWWLLLVLLLARLVMFLLGAHSMASGGLMLPTLALGALLGALVNCIMRTLGMPSDQEKLIILLSMMALFALVNKTPFTALFLTISVGGYLNILNYIWPTLILMSVVFLFTRVIKIDNITDSSRKLLRTSRKEKIIIPEDVN